MSRWTHSICRSCWDLMNPGRRPFVMPVGQVEVCCSCSMSTDHGIYVRQEPDSLSCLGVHVDG